MGCCPATHQPAAKPLLTLREQLQPLLLMLHNTISSSSSSKQHSSSYCSSSSREQTRRVQDSRLL